MDESLGHMKVKVHMGHMKMKMPMGHMKMKMKMKMPMGNMKVKMPMEKLVVPSLFGLHEIFAAQHELEGQVLDIRSLDKDSISRRRPSIILKRTVPIALQLITTTSPSF